ncbi:uncharacterized protein LOC141714156 [Apium graveolens]|uniref:uncharacterized protein LOC141714156 n=1 Tax=Apium graveolens TaxID=4045 RepID=UPI003D7B4A38
MTTQDAEKSHDVVSSTLQLCAQDVHVLFDSGSTHSFVNIKYVYKLNVPMQSLDNGFLVKLSKGRNLSLSKHRTNLNCYKKRICLTGSNQKKAYFKGDSVEKHSVMISVLKACKMLRKGGEGFLAYVVGNEGIKNKVEDIPIVKEFLDVFPDELPGLPPEREIEFILS